jgi:hypothetical protein
MDDGRAAAHRTADQQDTLPHACLCLLILARHHPHSPRTLDLDGGRIRTPQLFE